MNILLLTAVPIRKKKRKKRVSYLKSIEKVDRDKDSREELIEEETECKHPPEMRQQVQKLGQICIEDYPENSTTRLEV